MEENKKKVKNEIQENVEENNKQDNKGKKAIWVIILIIFIAIIFVVAYGMLEIFTNQEDDCTNNENTDINNYTNSENNNIRRRIISPTDIREKPIIYLYPEKETDLQVKLGNPEKVTCSYPKYTDGWNVIARPDGTIIDKDTGRKLYSLYWEGEGTSSINMNEGFVIKGEDSAKFLEEKLEILGLTQREAEEFIVYWLPKLEASKYNYIRFATIAEINEYMPLEFSVKPDTIIRVLMQFKGLNEPINIQEQKLETPERKGFVAVEWGGTEIK